MLSLVTPKRPVTMATKRKRGDSRERLIKKQMAIYLDPEQAEALAKLSAKTRVPQQVYLREGLDIVLAKNGIKVRS